MRFPALMMMAALVWAVVGGGAQASEFRGQYNGIGTAAGMNLVLQEAEGRIVGRFSPLRGEDYAVNGRRTGEAAQGGLQRTGHSAFFHLEMRPMGVQFLLIPSKPDGTPDLNGSTDYSFVREGTVIPEPSRFEPAPPRGVPVDIFQFIDSYRDWDPQEMTRIYAAMDTRYRELIQLFDHASAELLWRICVTSPPGPHFSAEDLEQLLERQQTECPAYLDAVRAMRDAGFFPEFVRKANFQFELIRETVKCDRGMSPESKCADVGVMSAPLMMRWQRAMGIMLDYVGAPGSESASSASPVPEPIARPQRSSEPLTGGTIVETEAEEPDLAAAPGAPLPMARPGRHASSIPEEIEPEISTGDEVEAVFEGYLPRPRPGVRLRR